MERETDRPGSFFRSGRTQTVYTESGKRKQFEHCMFRVLPGVPMITRTAAHIPTDPLALAAHGGFAWWYVDLIDEHGTGVVIIWAFGLPFLPGYAASARRGCAPEARARPSVTVSAYQGGKLVFYDLQEYGPEQASYSPADHIWTFGSNRFQWVDHPDTGERTLQIDLDRSIPGTTERLTGTVRVSGRLCTEAHPPKEQSDAPSHVWSPMLLGCTGTATLDAGDFHLQLDGRAYHDRNAGIVPLHALGIGRWWWGRVSFPDRDFIWYRLQPDDGGPMRQMTLTVDRQGVLTDLSSDILLGPDVAGAYGLSSPSSVHFADENSHPVVVSLDALVDDGPFYQRHLVQGLYRGHRGRGFAEYVVPDQVDRDLHRPFVRMRVHHLDGPNSLFLPLFSGPRTGRPGRLLRWWTGAA